MINVLGSAIWNRFDAENTFQVALTGGLWFGIAPDSATYPFGTFNIDGIVRDEIMGTSTGTSSQGIFKADIRIQVFSKTDDGGTAIGILLDKAIDCFDWCTLTITGYTPIKMGGSIVAPIIPADEIWQGSLLYEVWFQKT